MSRLFLLVLILVSGCVELPVVDFNATTSHVSSNGNNTLRVAVASVVSPKESYIYYNELLDYLSQKLGMRVELEQRKGYREVNKLVLDREVDLAFICGGAYVAASEGMELLAAPTVYPEPVYYSYIIVPRNSTTRDFSQLRGARFAFTDPLSNSGRYYPVYLLARMNETPSTFFGSYIFTYGHDKSIFAVARGLVDGAAVDSLVWDYLNQTHPEITSKTRIIQRSPPFGIPPVVVPRNLNKTLKMKLRKTLLEMHHDPQGKRILSKIKVREFVPVNDSNYDSIRNMREYVLAK